MLISSETMNWIFHGSCSLHCYSTSNQRMAQHLNLILMVLTVPKNLRPFLSDHGYNFYDEGTYEWPLTTPNVKGKYNLYAPVYVSQNKFI